MRLPGLVYLLVARRAMTMTVAAVAVEGGATVELIGSGLSSVALAFVRDFHASARGQGPEPVVRRANEPAG